MNNHKGNNQAEKDNFVKQWGYQSGQVMSLCWSLPQEEFDKLKALEKEYNRLIQVAANHTYD